MAKWPVYVHTDDVHTEFMGRPSVLSVPGTSVITPPEYDSLQTSAGPYCNDHRSLYCEHALSFIGSRDDVPYIRWVLTGESPYEGWQQGRETSGPEHFNMYIVVPIFPEYCVWEKLSYELRTIDPIGPCGQLESAAHSKNLTAVKRILPGESAADLSMSLRQQFEDDLDYYREKLVSAQHQPTWLRCKSQAHSFKYNNMAQRIIKPNVIQGAIDCNTDRVLVYAMLYCLMRHKRCLFCYVNENFRDAVRVNPELSTYMGDLMGDNDFEDVIPDE